MRTGAANDAHRHVLARGNLRHTGHTAQHCRNRLTNRFAPRAMLRAARAFATRAKPFRAGFRLDFQNKLDGAQGRGR
ncbi:hypothetical protein Busp01_20880 [Trinickia caryophylli]|nr:hypothetical protein Busp01_20880 [Trinickia caryophylli]